jgi:hypothetical protein
MSSLAAARADNFYHPPDFDPKKHKSLNKVNMRAWQPIQCYSSSSPMLRSLGPIFPWLDSRFLTSSSQYNNSHGALGVRANKLESHGILVIRCACVRACARYSLTGSHVGPCQGQLESDDQTVPRGHALDRPYAV